MALNPVDDTQRRRPIARSGRIRRCSVRHVSILATMPASVHVDCLLGGREHPLPLGSLEESRAICNACTARGVWREDED